MEQNKPYLMWMKSKQMLSSSPSPISWEEQAFAEDASGPFVWPPRSYSCTFCNREFRSAQALGGHMNVHRRDRARLKQQSTSLSDENDSSPKNSDQETDFQEPFSANKKKKVSFSSSSNSPRHDDNHRSWINILDDDDDDNDVETNLCVGMKPCGSKRLRSGAAATSSSPSSFYHKRPCSSSSIDDVIDLELRLGESPAAVK